MFININMKTYDVIIIGMGASGMLAAARAIKNGHNVAIVDMGSKPGRKVAVSGGGRCNFTNMAAAPERYFGKNRNKKEIHGFRRISYPQNPQIFSTVENFLWKTGKG